MQLNNLRIWLHNLFTKFTKFFVRYNSDIKMNELIYFDFETTGLNPYHDKIIEYAFLSDELHSDETYIQSLVNPETKMDKKITDIMVFTQI